METYKQDKNKRNILIKGLMDFIDRMTIKEATRKAIDSKYFLSTCKNKRERKKMVEVNHLGSVC
jgi:hypothetical protein